MWKKCAHNVYLCSCIRQSMGNIQKQSTNISSSHQTFKSTGHIIEQTHGISKKINWSQNKRRLTSKFLEKTKWNVGNPQMIMETFTRYGKTNRHTDKQTDRQTDGQTNKQTHRQTNKQTNTQTNKQTDKQTRRQTNKQTHKQTNRQTDTHTQTNWLNNMRQLSRLG